MKTEIALCIEWQDQDDNLNAVMFRKKFDLEQIPRVGDLLWFQAIWSPHRVEAVCFLVDAGEVEIYCKSCIESSMPSRQDISDYELDGWEVEWDTTQDAPSDERP